MKDELWQDAEKVYEIAQRWQGDADALESIKTLARKTLQHIEEMSKADLMTRQMFLESAYKVDCCALMVQIFGMRGKQHADAVEHCRGLIGELQIVKNLKDVTN